MKDLYTDLTAERKRSILEKIISCLRRIHGFECSAYDEESYREAYLGKTYDRLEKVRDLIPFANDRTVTVNGKVCRNIFYCRDEVEKLVIQYAMITSFSMRRTAKEF